MPVTWLQLFRSKFDWDYLTEPQPELNGRRIYWPRGKTLGGSSSLRPALRRRNLRLLTEATVTRVILEGSRAVGVEFQKNGRRQSVRARREVVLCAGAVNSPQLLMLSGIGDREQLRSHGIEVVQHFPQVGENLQDHLGAVLGFQAQGETRFATGKPMQLLANYLIRRRGRLSSSAGEAYGFVRSRPDLALPDLELFFGPGPFFDEGLAEPRGHAFTTSARIPSNHTAAGESRCARPTPQPSRSSTRAISPTAAGSTGPR